MSAKAKAHTDRNVSAKELAHLFNGLTERRIQQLAAEGIVVREGRGRYNLVESTRRYIATLQDANMGLGGAGEDYSNARNQKMRADADRSIMEAAQLAGSLVPTDLVRHHWEHMIGAVRAKLLNLPKKTAPLVQHEQTFAKCRAVLNAAIHECLAELSDYEPPDTHARSFSSLLSRTSARSKDKPVGRRKTKAK